MDTNQINRVLKSYIFTRKEFCGVLPIDYLPIKKIKRPCSFVINTDKSSLPGKHWFAIYLPLKGKIEYFDSFGIKPLIKKRFTYFSKKMVCGYIIIHNYKVTIVKVVENFVHCI